MVRFRNRFPGTCSWMRSTVSQSVYPVTKTIGASHQSSRYCAIGVEQHRFVVDESPCQRIDLGRLRYDGLCAREAPRVLLSVQTFSSVKKVPSMLNTAISSP